MDRKYTEFNYRKKNNAIKFRIQFLKVEKECSDPYESLVEKICPDERTARTDAERFKTTYQAHYSDPGERDKNIWKILRRLCTRVYRSTCLPAYYDQYCVMRFFFFFSFGRIYVSSQQLHV